MNKTKIILWLMAIALAATSSFSACSDDDENNIDNKPADGDSIAITSFDDLFFFQTSIVPIDTLGQFEGRAYGEPLDNNDTTHIYIGVETLAEAEEMFRTWIAPDVELSTTVPTTNGLTCPMTDIEGKPQGIIYFKPGTESGHVAEVTASEGTDLKHFNRITFLLNSAWPYNSDEQYFFLGDIVPFAAKTVKNDLFTIPIPFLFVNIDISDGSDEEVLDFVCIKEGGNGVKPQFISTYPKNVEADQVEDGNAWIPSVGTAEGIGKIISKDWDYWVEVFKEARCGQLNDEYYWYDQWRGYGYLLYQSAINLKKNKHEYFWGEREKKILFNQNRKTDIQVLNDHAISLTGTAGSPTVKDEGYKNLFDRNNDTKWTSNSKKDGVWYVEFQCFVLGTPSKYKLITGNDTKKNKDRSPVSWKLYGKRFISDQWKLMDEVTDGGLPIDDKKTKEYTIANQGTYQYYRFEVSKNTGGTHVQLDGFDFVY